MNHKVSRHTELTTRGMNAERMRDKKAEQKENARPDEATIIVSKPSLFKKWLKKYLKK